MGEQIDSTKAATVASKLVAAFKHLSGDVTPELLETHVSWVLRGPRDVWKVKKPEPRAKRRWHSIVACHQTFTAASSR
jgi:hypothetical protein